MPQKTGKKKNNQRSAQSERQRAVVVGKTMRSEGQGQDNLPGKTAELTEQGGCDKRQGLIPKDVVAIRSSGSARRREKGKHPSLKKSGQTQKNRFRMKKRKHRGDRRLWKKNKGAGSRGGGVNGVTGRGASFF